MVFDGGVGEVKMRAHLRGNDIRFSLLGSGPETETFAIVNWINEEGCRFQSSSRGAEVAAGHISSAVGDVEPERGITYGDALDRMG